MQFLIGKLSFIMTSILEEDQEEEEEEKDEDDDDDDDDCHHFTLSHTTCPTPAF